MQPHSVSFLQKNGRVDTDEYPKAGVTMEGIAKLRPAFDIGSVATQVLHLVHVPVTLVK
jgi:acetyl-CoA acetyltransferase